MIQPLHKFRTGITLLLVLSGIFFLLPAMLHAAPGGWETLAPGLELGRFPFPGASSSSDSVIIIVRADSKQWALEAHSISESGDKEGKSSRDWAKAKKMAVVINAGMYDSDRRTHVGMMFTPSHSNNRRPHGSYKAAIAFDPVHPEDNRWRSVDLDILPMDEVRKRYGSVVQNLRLIKRSRQNRWNPGGKSWWSEAALGEDDKGRLLLIYTPAVVTMYDFNKALLALPIGLETAQHLEGGLQAQLYIEIGRKKFEFHSGRETDFKRRTDAASGLPIPNVLGLRRK